MRNFIQEKIEVPLLLSLLKSPSHAHILEVGCGQGIALPVLFNCCKPASLSGIDLDKTLIISAENYAREREESKLQFIMLTS
ncbi:MAG: hypothetical protein A3I05_06100 [Deltaproteobacteria bacterium RIFCSPLOWO2_02_FULL_44_10]|nr:MAG: hypothetical protein A3C46_04005 [Deltaproteobacteria bacterium RIFCSPHIGHO2_02_FULL_44_16]OGQ45688.1 MAG: hypothetical protein A3I05_06100 [Deltaproteobacteria bacterium RIFCSPLOWO2_02_FULL_44_10]